MENVQIGNFVHTIRHKYYGRISGIFEKSPNDKSWLDKQDPPLTKKQRSGKFVKILELGYGVVCVPISDIEPAEERPFFHLAGYDLNTINRDEFDKLYKSIDNPVLIDL